MPGKRQTQRGDAARAYSLGFEFACAVAGFVLVGLWIDRHYSSGPWATLVCLSLGLIGGFYNLIRGASRLSSGPRSSAGGEAASALGASPSGGSRPALPARSQNAERDAEPAVAARPERYPGNGSGPAGTQR